MATEKQINYAKSLVRNAGKDPEAYVLNESIPNKNMSDFIDGFRNGEGPDPEEWNEEVSKFNAASKADNGGAYDKKTLIALVGNINSQFVKAFMYKMIDKVPEYFYSVAASSTGKYHPDYALGNGGLVRHTMAAVKIAMSLFDNPALSKYNRDQKDMILAALILHDTCKHGLVKNEYTVHEHPMLVEKLWDPTTMEVVMTPEQAEMVEIIFGCIRSHMGPWTNSNYSQVTLPKPENGMQNFVHLCDYLASRNFLEVNFNK
jgi:hypothetical protein